MRAALLVFRLLVVLALGAGPAVVSVAEAATHVHHEAPADAPAPAETPDVLDVEAGKEGALAEPLVLATPERPRERPHLSDETPPEAPHASAPTPPPDAA